MEDCACFKAFRKRIHRPGENVNDELLIRRFKPLLDGTSIMGLRMLHKDWTDYQKKIKNPSRLLAKLILAIEERIEMQETV